MTHYFRSPVPLYGQVPHSIIPGKRLKRLRLVNAYTTEGAVEILYELLKEREQNQNISHREMPSFEQHCWFFSGIPYVHWLLISYNGAFVGSIYVTDKDEIAVFVFKKYHGKGIGPVALQRIMSSFKPRSGSWHANINPQNERSIRVFEKLGFVHIQNTYRLDTE